MRARPIISAPAVAEVRRGLRTAFLRASWPAVPSQGRNRSGRPSSEATGPATSGLSRYTPMKMPSAPPARDRMIGNASSGVKNSPHPRRTTPTARKTAPSTVLREPLPPNTATSSRRAAMGGILAALRDGSSADRNVAPIPNIRATMIVRGAKIRSNDGSAKPRALNSALSPSAIAAPAAMPTTEAIRPRSRDSSSTALRTCRLLAPSVRSRAISLMRWPMTMLKVLLMMNAATNSITSANPSRTLPRIPVISPKSSDCSSMRLSCGARRGALRAAPRSAARSAAPGRRPRRR